MKKYLKFKIGDTVEVIKSMPKNQPPIKAGVRFAIESFPPCTVKAGTKHNYFLFGKTKDGSYIRALVEEVKLIKTIE